MTYEQKCALLGIERPASLRGKFPDAPNGALQGKVQGLHNLPMGERKASSEPPEDLSHLNPERGKSAQEHTKKWWGKQSAKERSKRNQNRFPKHEAGGKKNFWHAQSK